MGPLHSPILAINEPQPQDGVREDDNASLPEYSLVMFPFKSTIGNVYLLRVLYSTVHGRLTY